MVMRFDPFRDIDRFFQALSSEGGRGRSGSMPMDAYREGDEFTVKLDLPGIDPDGIDLTVEKNVLTVKAERKWQASEGQDVLVAERPQGTFSRQLFLGESLDPDNIDATYDHGVLTLTIPVKPQAKPRKVQVSGASDRQTIDTGEKPSGSAGQSGAK
jgi:HSP20 family protein